MSLLRLLRTLVRKTTGVKPDANRAGWGGAARRGRGARPEAVVLQLKSSLGALSLVGRNAPTIRIVVRGQLTEDPDFPLRVATRAGFGVRPRAFASILVDSRFAAF